MKFNPTTNKGYSLFEVSSALQKSIRRGLERESLYWGYELEISNYGKYLWKRLVIIAIEDIGPATPDVLTHTLSFQKAYDDLKKKKSDGADLAIAAAIIYLCRSEKSRLYDWATCLMLETHEHHNLEIPDFALDVHTRRGKQMGRGMPHFFETCCKLSPYLPAEGEEDYMEAVSEFYCKMTKEERQAKKTCKTLPDEHPDKAGSCKKVEAAKQQPDLFEES